MHAGGHAHARCGHASLHCNATAGQEQLAQLLGPDPKRGPHRQPTLPLPAPHAPHAAATPQAASEPAARSTHTQQPVNGPSSAAAGPIEASAAAGAGVLLGQPASQAASAAAVHAWHVFYRRIRAALRGRVPDVQVLVKLYASLEGQLGLKHQQGGGGGKKGGKQSELDAALDEVDGALGQQGAAAQAAGAPPPPQCALGSAAGTWQLGSRAQTVHACVLYHAVHSVLLRVCALHV